MESAFTNLLIIVAAGFAAPLALGFVPSCACRRSSWRSSPGSSSAPRCSAGSTSTSRSQVLALLGLAFLLFLAGLEIDVERCAAALLRSRSLGFGLSSRSRSSSARCTWPPGFVECAAAVAIILSATSLGVVVPVLKDAGGATDLRPARRRRRRRSPTSRRSSCYRCSSPRSRRRPTRCSLGGLVAVAGSCRRAVAGAEPRARLRDVLRRCRTRPRRSASAARSCCWSGSSAIADQLGLEAILGAFIAGAILSLLDRDRARPTPTSGSSSRPPASASSSPSSS